MTASSPQPRYGTNSRPIYRVKLGRLPFNIPNYGTRSQALLPAVGAAVDQLARQRIAGVTHSFSLIVDTSESALEAKIDGHLRIYAESKSKPLETLSVYLSDLFRDRGDRRILFRVIAIA